MRIWIVLLVSSVLALSGCNEEKKNVDVSLDTLSQRVSYSVGYDVAKNFKDNEFDLDMAIVLAGLNDAQNSVEPRLSQEQIAATMTEFQQYMVEQHQKKADAKSQVNVAEGEAFLTANKVKEGVVTLESGLQYKVITEGAGRKPLAEDVVQVHYRGTLTDGTEFDSSYDRGQPAEFPVSRVIAGWTEALQLMTEGSKWQLVIPANLAYGEQAMGGVIAPNSVLVFDVELLKVLSDDSAATVEPATSEVGH
jgi:FKBP-type peptidyl-prolyl cis-trans isomerase FklB